MLGFQKQLRISLTVLIIALGASSTLPAPTQAQWAAAEGAAPVPLSHIAHPQKADHSSVATRQDASHPLTPLTITLAPPTAGEKSALHIDTQNPVPNLPLQIGFGRNIPVTFQGDVSTLLDWTPTADGGLVAHLHITSPQALALRVALAVSSSVHNRPDVEVRFMSLADPSQVFGPFGAQDLLTPAAAQTKTEKGPKANAEPFWSPVMEGDTIGIEVFLPSPAARSSFSLQLLHVSHLVDSVRHSQAKRLADIGRSGLCNIDMACQSTDPSNLAAATAKIVYTRNGSSFLCTGTLLNDNDGDTFIPYFLTANHCLSDPATAGTVNSFWFFERMSCDGSNPTSVTQVIGGSDLLASEQVTDFTFLQLNDATISNLSGIWFAGWDSSPLTNPAPILSIHHPRGDLKKWSAGNTTGFTPNPLLIAPPNASSHVRLIWSQGTTEPGSSGSGLFDTNGNLRGTLSGGVASCSAQGEPDFYGRFDHAFPSVERWLSFVPAQLSSGSMLSGSVQQGAWSEYKITTTSNDAQLIVRLTGLNQDADLYVRSGSRPSFNQFDCRPFTGDITAETCNLPLTGNQVYYIGINGFAADTTQFTLAVEVQSTSGLRPGHFDFCTETQPCAQGEGDCDSDRQCQGGLICRDDVGATYGFDPIADVCEVSSGGPRFGGFDFCTTDKPCAQSEGDCDSNSECQDGLICVSDIGARYGFDPIVDVCEVTGPPLGSFDFCSETNPCGQGEGDCDRNNECRDGLQCLNRDFGVLYGFDPLVDVCEVPGTRRGNFDYCAVAGPCPAGAGDCDNDSECLSGLRCLDDVGALYGFDPTIDVCDVP